MGVKTGERVFDAAARQSQSIASWLTLNVLFILSVPPFAVGVNLLGPYLTTRSALVNVLLFIVSLFIYCLVVLKLYRHLCILLARKADRRLATSLAERLRAEGLEPPLDLESLYGISPNEELRNYEGDTDWDVGSLFFNKERLIFLGDRCAFSLYPDQIRKIKIEPPAGRGTIDPPRMLLQWQDKESEDGGVLAIHARGCPTSGEYQNRLTRLLHRITKWQTLYAASSHPSSQSLGCPPPANNEGEPFGQTGAFSEAWGYLSILYPTMIVIQILDDIPFLSKDHSASIFIIAMVMLLMGTISYGWMQWCQRKKNNPLLTTGDLQDDILKQDPPMF